MSSRPFTLSPEPGESLTGYITRYNSAGISVPITLPHNYRDGPLPAAALAFLADKTGLEPERFKEMTTTAWPVTLRGRKAQRRHGWALHHRVRWTCPRCTPTVGYQALRWRLALAPVCLRCGTVLINATRLESARPANALQMHIVRKTDLLVTAALAGSGPARTHLSLLRRICSETASRIAARQPGSTALTVAVVPELAASWAAYPSEDPTTVLQLLELAGSALDSPQRARKVAGELTAGRSLVLISPEPAAAEAAAKSGRARLRSLIHTLTGLSRFTGLQPRHLPTIFTPAQHARGTRPREAEDHALETLALHILLDRATGGTGSATAAFNFHGIPTHITNHELLDAVRRGSGLTGPQRDQILSRAQAVVDSGLIDYRLRRGVLDSQPRLHRVPASVHAVQLATSWPAKDLVAGWLWVHYARSLPQYGPLPQVPLFVVNDFDAALDAETRLHLFDAADTHVYGPDLQDLINIPSPATTTSMPRQELA